MRLIKPATIALVTTLAVGLSANAAMARGYTGNWPLTVTHAQHSDGAFCATLKDDGNFGWPHSGLASVGRGASTLYGTFQVIDRTIIITIEQPGEGGQNAALLFIAPADNGRIGKGVFEQAYGGEEFDSGVLLVGMKGGC